MPKPAALRQLLYGLLALQNGLIDDQQLVTAFQSWTRDKSRDLAGLLLSRGDLGADQHQVITALLDLHMKKYGGDLEQSLSTLSIGRSTRELFEQLDDVDVDATIDKVGTTERSPGGANATARPGGYELGMTTSHGQRFRVLRPHARGGLGVVFVALDGELNREVALKQIVDHHADDPVSRQRFLLEAEVTGGLEHPGIVPVYGLGTYADGRPFYAMRFIRGDSLKEAIDRFHSDQSLRADPGRRSVELRKLLRRLLDVCNAIDYAHSRGVLHRDIKPGNVIVGRHGETLVVDWGLAKTTGRGDPTAGEQSLIPSSASGSAETLPGSAVGTPAYMSPEQAAGDLALLGPHSDVYSLGATLYSVLTGGSPVEHNEIGAALRAVQAGDFRPPRQRDPSIDKALEAICLKAMALRPEDRYASPRSIVEDLERWMADEPVTAWREPPARRLRRWARRNRTKVTAAAVAVVAGLIGLGAVTAVQAQANSRLQAANDQVNRVNSELAGEKARVQERYDLAMTAIKTFHTGVSEDFLLKEDRFKDLRDRLLNSAGDFYGKLGALLKGQSDAASRRALGQANFELADLTAKVGRKQAALEAHQRVLALREALAAEPGAAAEAHADVGRSLIALGREQEALGKTSDALVSYETARSRLEAIAKAGPARAFQADLATAEFWLGWLHWQTGKIAEGLDWLNRSRDRRESLVRSGPAPAQLRNDLALSYYNTAWVLSQTGKPAEALEACGKALAIQQQLVDSNPGVALYQSDLANTHHVVGAVLYQQHKIAETLKAWRAVLEIRRKLALANPAVSAFQRILAVSHYNLGLAERSGGDPAAALASYNSALEIQKRLADANPGVTMYWRDLARTYNVVGNLSRLIRKTRPALESYRQALEIQARLAAANPGVNPLSSDLALSHQNIAATQAQARNATAAIQSFRTAIAIQHKLARANPTVTEYWRDLADSASGLGLALSQSGQLDDALGARALEESACKALVDVDPSLPDHHAGLATARAALADLLTRKGGLAAARAACDRAIAGLKDQFDHHPDSPAVAAAMAEVLLRDGSVRAAQGDAAAAATSWKRALSILDRVRPASAEQSFIRACCHAGLSSLAGRPGSAIPAAARAVQADLALQSLHQAITDGFRSQAALRDEPALASIRSQPGFDALLLDVDMPDQPLADAD